jgi:hypothetical protein
MADEDAVQLWSLKDVLGRGGVVLFWRFVGLTILFVGKGGPRVQESHKGVDVKELRGGGRSGAKFGGGLF